MTACVNESEVALIRTLATKSVCKSNGMGGDEALITHGVQLSVDAILLKRHPKVILPQLVDGSPMHCDAAS
jgi:hypothetical protein